MTRLCSIRLAFTWMVRALAAEPLPVEFRDIFAKPVLINVGVAHLPEGTRVPNSSIRDCKAPEPELQLVIIGQGELHDRLLGLASELNISDSVHLLGFDTNPYRYLARAKVLA